MSQECGQSDDAWGVWLIRLGSAICLIRFKYPIDACPANTQSLGYLRSSHTLLAKCQHLLGFRPRARLPALVFSSSLGLGDALPLALQHDLALKLGDAPE